MDISEIRYSNARLLVEEAGSMVAFAEKIGKAPTQASAIAGKNPRKGIGNRIAREIEEAFGKTRGWLDRPHSHSADPMTLLAEEISDFSQAELNELKAYIELMKKRNRGEL